MVHAFWRLLNRRGQRIKENRQLIESSLDTAIASPWLSCSLFRFQCSRWLAYYDHLPSPKRGLSATLRASCDAAGLTDSIELINCITNTSFYINKRRRNILQAVLEHGLRTDNSTAVVFQLADACGHCVGRQKQVFELLIESDPVGKEETLVESQGIFSILILGFIDELKRTAISKAFIEPLHHIFQNNPEIEENLDSHGRSFWCTVVENLSGIKAKDLKGEKAQTLSEWVECLLKDSESSSSFIALPYEDISFEDVGWAWGARDFLRIFELHPEIAPRNNFDIREVASARDQTPDSLLSASRSTVASPTCSPARMSRQVEKFPVESFLKHDLRFKSTDWLLPFVTTGSVAEFSGFIDCLRRRTISRSHASLLANYGQLFTAFLNDKKFILTELCRYLIKKKDDRIPFCGITTTEALESIGWSMSDLCEGLEDPDEFRFRENQADALLRDMGVKLFKSETVLNG